MTDQLTVLFMPESAYGPTNQCIGIGKVLLTAKDETSAASLFDIHYEKSSGGARKRRMEFARAILEKHGDTAVSEVLSRFSTLPPRKAGPDTLAICSE